MKYVIVLVLFVVGVIFACLTGGLVWLGCSASWTSDGPGMLFIMMGVAIGAVITLMAFGCCRVLLRG